MSSDNQFENLIREARDGKPEDKAALLESFRDYLRRIAVNALSDATNGKLSASDVVQSAIIEAHRDFEFCKAEKRDEFKSWLRQIILNDILNRFRDLKRAKRDVRREKPIGSKFDLEAIDADPLSEAVRKEDEERLADALQKLSSERRSVVELKHRDGLSFVEIAHKLDKSPDAIRMIWNRAIESLSKIIGEQPDAG